MVQSVSKVLSPSLILGPVMSTNHKTKKWTELQALTVPSEQKVRTAKEQIVPVCLCNHLGGSHNDAIKWAIIEAVRTQSNNVAAVTLGAHNRNIYDIVTLRVPCKLDTN